MDEGKDESAPSQEKKTAAKLKTAQGDASEGAEAKPVHRLTGVGLLSSPVLADAGTTLSIEGTASSSQILPFESQVQGHIGRQLRALYDHVLDQPIPDRFLSLLQQLDDGPLSDGGDGTDAASPTSDPTDPKGVD